MLFFFQAEDGIRDLVRSRGLGDVYKRQKQYRAAIQLADAIEQEAAKLENKRDRHGWTHTLSHADRVCWREISQIYLGEEIACLLYTSDAADERSSGDLGGRGVIKKKKRDDALERGKKKR